MDLLRGRSIVHPSDGERRRECLAVLRGSALASRTGGDIVTPFASTASLSPNGDGRWQVPQLTLCDGQQTRGQKRATPADVHVTWLDPTSDRGQALCVEAVAALAALVLRLRVWSLTQGRGWHRRMWGSGSFPLGLRPATGVEQVDYRCVSLVGRSVSTTVCKTPWVTLPTTTCDDVNAVLAWAATLGIRRRRGPGGPETIRNGRSPPVVPRIPPHLVPRPLACAAESGIGAH